MNTIPQPKLPTVEMTHIVFIHEPVFDGPKTHCWEVYNKHEKTTRLGRVSWFGRWTKYAFFPWPETVFEQVCLRDIAQFCEDRTREQRQAAAKRAAGVRRDMKTTNDLVKAVAGAQKNCHKKPMLIRHEGAHLHPDAF